MTVSHIFDCVDIKEVMWNFAKELPTIDLKNYNQPLIDVLALNSRCEFDTTDPEPSLLKKRTFGDASESGIMRFTSLYFQKSMLKELSVWRETHSKKFKEVPFSSVYKFQLSVHMYNNKQDLITLKGAPEKVFKVFKQLLFRLINNMLVLASHYNSFIQLISSDLCIQSCINIVKNRLLQQFILKYQYLVKIATLQNLKQSNNYSYYNILMQIRLSSTHIIFQFYMYTILQVFHFKVLILQVSL
ncbi:Sodium/potassium-transporting_ATPase alpha chain [Hexamita inflata]|uniref:Sodium/potassium-transporting_ATPase alpha chain n=1 Tax=Hexamita inflata TaxID=28002 RepID=A0ABP1ICF2_9EUKA